MALQDILAELAVNLRLDTAQYAAGVSKAEAQTSRLERRLSSFQRRAGGIARTMASLGGGIVGGFAAGLGVATIVHATDAALRYAGSLKEVAETLGLTTRDLQTFRYAAGQVGVSQEDLETGIQKLTISMGRSVAGSQQQIKAFKALGISVEQLKRSDGGDIFRRMADKLQTVSDRSQRAAVEVALLGKSGAKLDNLLSGAEGKLSELSDAAERLGIVLSDDQIQNADRTADRIDALKTVLEARIAGVVADNAAAIYNLADSLATLAGAIARFLGSDPQRAIDLIAGLIGLRLGGPAGAGVGAAGAEAVSLVPKILQDLNIGQGGSSSVTVHLDPPKPAKIPHIDLPKFLSGGGGGADKSAELMHKRLAALGRQNELDQRSTRAQEDILRAQEAISTDYSDRTTIGVQILDLERQAYKRQLDFEVQEFKISKGEQGISQATADILLAMYDRKDHFDRQALLDREEEDRQKDFNRLEEVSFSIQRERLDGLSSLAETDGERRKIELQILELAYREKKERLDRIIKESKDWATIEEARRELAAMPRQFAIDKANSLKGTRGPLEDFLASLPTTAAKANEALQRIEVEGLQGLEQGIIDVISGTKKLGQAFSDLAKQILADLLKIGIERLIIAPLANTLFGPSATVPGRAGGGSVLGGSAYLVGERGPELFIPSGTGRVISNDNTQRMLRGGWGAGGGVTQIFDIRTPDADSFRRNQRQIMTRAKRGLRA